MTQALGTWKTVSVGDHPCHVYEPPTRNEQGYVVLYLHGVHLGTLHDKASFLQQFDRFGLPVVCPVTQRSWWTDRLCPEFDARTTAQQHVMENVLPFVRDQYNASPPRIGLLGTSMGGQGALRFAYRFPDQFPVVAAIAPAIDYHLRLAEGDELLEAMYGDTEAARQDTVILHIHPLNWPRHQFFCCDPSDYRWFDSSDRLRMKLNSIGVPFECDLETTVSGHGFEYYERMAETAVGFIYNRLERERLRIV